MEVFQAGTFWTINGREAWVRCYMHSPHVYCTILVQKIQDVKQSCSRLDIVDIVYFLYQIRIEARIKYWFTKTINGGHQFTMWKNKFEDLFLTKHMKGLMNISNPINMSIQILQSTFWSPIDRFGSMWPPEGSTLEGVMSTGHAIPKSVSPAPQKILGYPTLCDASKTLR